MVSQRARVACLVFGPNPSSEVRAIARKERAARVSVDWEILQLEPYFSKLRLPGLKSHWNHRLRRALGKFLTPLILAANWRRITSADGVYVIKLPPKWLTRLLEIRVRISAYDFDDPLWLDSMKGSSWFRFTVGRYALITCDNAFALDYLRENGIVSLQNVFLIPGEVPKSSLPLEGERNSRGLRLVWPGSASTFHYLLTIRDPLLEYLRSRPDSNLEILGVSSHALRAGGLDHPHVELKETYGPTDLSLALTQADVGLFPLNHEALSYLRGLHKVFLYQSAGLPVLASRVLGIGSAVTDGENGLIMDSSDDWLKAFNRLTDDAALRTKLTLGAVSSHFDYESHTDDAFREFLRRLLE